MQLAHADFSKPFHIATDASQTGCGGVLFQPRTPDEHITADNIVTICSKKFNENRQRWCAYKKELFGVVYSLRQFHSYVWGRTDLVVHTDHKPLIHMFQSSQLSPALQQWLDVLLDYAFEIRHREGILNIVPDAISRMYGAAYEHSPVWGVDPRFPAPPPDDEPTQSAPLPLRSLDVNLAPIGVGEGEISADSIDPSAPSSSLLHQDSTLAVELEKRGKKCPATADERSDLIAAAHAFGHFGMEAVFKRIFNDGYWWPNIRKDIDDHLKSCDACTRFTVVKSGFHPAQFIVANGPAEHFQIDTSVHLPVSPDGYTALLVCIDVFTGFVILRPLRNTTAELVAAELWSIFSILGLPKILQSDNGSEFNNDVLRTLIKLTGIEHRFISPYNPRADGKVERSIGTVTMIIKKLLHGTSQHWPIFVNFAQLTFNTKVSTLTGSTPFSLMFGRELNALKDYTVTDAEPNIISLDDWRNHQEKLVSLIYPALSERIRSGKDKLVQHLNKTRRQLLPTALPAGSTVMLKDPLRQNKFEPKYIGPYTISRRARNGGYVLVNATGDLYDRHVPADQLKLVAKSRRRIDVEQPIYEVHRIIDHRGEPGHYEYLVDWKGYTEEERTWEPQDQFMDQSVIQTYWREHAQRVSSAQ